MLLIKERKGKIIPDIGDHVFHAACMKCLFVCLFLVFHVVFKFFFTRALLFHSLLNFYALIQAHCSELSFFLPLWIQYVVLLCYSRRRKSRIGTVFLDGLSVHVATFRKM